MDGTEEDPGAPSRAAYTAPAGGERLDRLLTTLLDGPSRADVQALLGAGRVRVDGAVETRSSSRPAEGARLEVELVMPERTRPGSAEGARFEVLHEDDALAVLAKPAGMVVHPGGQVRGGTLSELAVERFGDLPDPQGEDRPGIVHRLDADTSGVIVIARTHAAAEELMRQFADREVEKTYTAIVHGVPRFDSDWIEGALARDERRPERMAVVPDGEGRAASTFYETSERFGRAALVAAHPRTGRTHQLRVHLASIGHPCVGDRLYRRRDTRDLAPDAPVPGRQALHAASLAFTHPATGERVRFEAPLPADLEALLAWLRASAAT
jgi:23S rRNA pseudouridine1911/1915/1917 synthase